MKPERLYLRTDYSNSIERYVKKVSVSKHIWEEIGAFYSNHIITFEAENIIQYFNDCTQPTQEEIVYFEVIYGKESKDAFLVWLEDYQYIKWLTTDKGEVIVEDVKRKTDKFRSELLGGLDEQFK